MGGRVASAGAGQQGKGFLPHRATTLGLPGLVTVVLLVVACLDRRPLGVLLAGVLAAILVVLVEVPVLQLVGAR